MSGSRGGEPATGVDSVTPLNGSANGDRFIDQCSERYPGSAGTRAVPTVGWVRLARVFGGSA